MRKEICKGLVFRWGFEMPVRHANMSFRLKIKLYGFSIKEKYFFGVYKIVELVNVRDLE